MQAKYHEMFKEFGALEQLSKLDKLRAEQSTSLHPWYEALSIRVLHKWVLVTNLSLWK